MLKTRWQFLIVCLLFISSLSSYAVVDSGHTLLESILKNNVKDGAVDYPAIANDSTFDKYLIELSKPLSASARNEQLAFWINAYNAFAIRGILDGKSPSTFFGRVAYFKNTKYNIADRRISLYDLEHKVIIPFMEPRIHFAINCASVSCPKLASKAYTASELEPQLESAARSFINDPTRNQFNRENKVAHLSKIFNWFEKDFEQHSGSVQKYIAQFVDDTALAEELRNEEYKVKFLRYDWSLNGTPATK